MRLLTIAFILIISSCGKDRIAQPRPHQYPRITYPAQEYKSYVNDECPFVLDIPTYAKTTKKKLLFDEVAADPCWFDISLEQLNATIHCSYYPISKNNTLDKLVNDAFTMASKHNVKASFREEYVIKNKAGHSGLMFKINGPVATPFQFYMTDSTRHFLRGSLYFDERVNQDSISPIVDFIEEDLDVMLNSLEWR